MPHFCPNRREVGFEIWKVVGEYPADCLERLSVRLHTALLACHEVDKIQNFVLQIGRQ